MNMKKVINVNTTVVLAKGGTDERIVEVREIVIPDLWHIANRLPADERDAVLETWHLAHNLLDHLKDE